MREQIIIQVPEGMTAEEKKNLANALHDVMVEWTNHEPQAGIYAMPGRELTVIQQLEQALRNNLN